MEAEDLVVNRTGIIIDSLGGMSPRERVFILALYPFFSDSTVVDLCAEFEYTFPTLRDITSLDFQHWTVIVQLIASYNGW